MLVVSVTGDTILDRDVQVNLTATGTAAGIYPFSPPATLT